MIPTCAICGGVIEAVVGDEERHATMTAAQERAHLAWRDRPRPAEGWA